MRVGDLRRRLLDRVAKASESGDEEGTATVAAYVGAALVALAPFPADESVSLRDLKVRTKTAALILGMHPEYVRTLIRRGFLPAEKENGEFRVRLEDVVELSMKRRGPTWQALQPPGYPAQRMVPLWQPRKEPPSRREPE